MEPEVLVIAVVGPAVLGLICVIGTLAARGAIGRNGFVGVRLPSTMASDAGWVAGHRAAVRPAGIATAVLLVADGVTLLTARSAPASTAAAIALVVLLLASIAVVTLIANRAARSADRA